MPLAIGAPYVWEEMYNAYGITFNDMDAGESAPYVVSPVADPKTTLAIRKFHEDNGYQIPSNCTIIIGLGAQHILANMVSIMGDVTYYAEPPCYPSYDALVSASGYRWGKADAQVEFVTTPNNPTGEVRMPVTNASTIIWDMVYSWPWYGYDHGTLMKQALSVGSQTTHQRYHIPIFSCSKSIGLAGTRFGYAILYPDVLRRYPNIIEKYNSQYVLYTNGASMPGILQCRAIMGRYTSFNHIKDILIERYDTIVPLLKHVLTGIEILSPRGFFYLWMKMPGKNLYEIFLSIGATLVPGTEFRVTNEYVRLNMCTYTKNFNALLRELRKHIENDRLHEQTAEDQEG